MKKIIVIIALQPNKEDTISLITTFLHNVNSTNAIDNSVKQLYSIDNIFTLNIPKDEYNTYYIKAIDQEGSVEIEIDNKKESFKLENLGEQLIIRNTDRVIKRITITPYIS